MQRAMQTMAQVLGVVLAGAQVACVPGESPAGADAGTQPAGTLDGGGVTTADAGPVPWRFAATTLNQLEARWGAQVAVVDATTAYLVGGVAGDTGPVRGDIIKVVQTAQGVELTPVVATLRRRYCGCAWVDAARGHLVVLGGRDQGFRDAPTADVVDLNTGVVTPLDVSAVLTHPVGCHAAFLPGRDEAYLINGLNSSRGEFSADLYRVNGADLSFTRLTVSGPAARYDGMLQPLSSSGPLLLTAGMGAGAVAYGDVWSLDPATTSWTQLSDGVGGPPGRRFPWVALSPSAANLLVGFGSDSPRGTTLLGDLWMFNLTDKTWTMLQPVDALAPRGFARWLPGPLGSVGLVHGGMDAQGVALGSAWLLAASGGALPQWP